VIEMVRDADGVWEATLPGDRHGTYYDFTVHGPTGAGTFFYETHPVHISDPYARVQAESQGKSRIWRANEACHWRARRAPQDGGCGGL
jgi:pullulanase